MATQFEKQITDSNGQKRMLTLDVTGATYLIKVDGVSVSAFPSQPADTQLVTVTAGVNITFLAAELGKVGFSGPANRASTATPDNLMAMGRVAALACNGGASQSAVFGV